MARGRQVRRKRQKTGSRWGKVLGICAAGVVVCLLMAVAGIYMWVKSYLKSSEFKEMVEIKTGGVLKGEGRFGEFVWTGSSAYTNSFEAQGYEDAWYSRMNAEGIRVDIDFGKSLRRGVWEVSRVDIDRVELDIKDERLPGFHPGVPDDPDSFFASFIPRKFELVDSKVDRFFFHFDGGSEVRLDDAQVQAKPRDTGGLALSGSHGTLVVSGLPDFRVEKFAARVDGEALVIDDMSLSFYEKAALTGRGEVVFRTRDEPGKMRIAYKVRNLDVKDIVDEDWKQKMSGRIRGDFSVMGTRDGLVHGGTLTLDEGVLEALPVLENIATYTNMNRFRRLILDGAEMRYSYRDGMMHVESVKLHSSDLLRIEGAAKVADGEIDGEFFLGVTPGTLKWLPGAHKRVFTMERSGEGYAGYVWTTMKVTGPVGGPREDLSARLLEAAGLAILVDAPTEAVKAVTGEGGAALLENAPEMVKDGVEAGTGLIETGVKAVRGFLPMLGN